MLQKHSDEIQALREKLDQDRKNKQEIQDAYIKLTNSVNEAVNENQKLKKFIGEKSLMEGIKKAIEEEDLKVLIDEIAFQEKNIDDRETIRSQKQDELDKNMRLRDLKVKNEEMTKTLIQKEKELDDLNYKCFEMEHRQELAIKQKEVETNTRMNLFEEYERLKTILEETEKANRLKVEKKIRDNESLELGRLEGILRKEQGELNETRVRYERIHNEFKNFKLTEYQMKKYLEKITEENTQ